MPAGEGTDVAHRAVVVGGDAGGMTAISQVRRGRPDAEVIVLERGRWTSYSACGIPYVVGGQVSSVHQLVARTPSEHRAAGIDLRLRHEAVALDVDGGAVTVRDLDADRTYTLGYDQLLLGTGGRPVRPDLPGIDLPFVNGVHTLDDALRLVEIASSTCPRVVVVGSGYIGLEVADAFAQRGCPTTVLERGPAPLGILDPDMSDLVAGAMRRHRIDLRTGIEVQGFDAQRGVLTDQGDVPADVVILGIGVEPRSELARDAGLRLGVEDAIAVDERQETSAGGIWAAGDCCESTHLVSGRPVHIALGTYANKQSRVAGINMGGGSAVMPRVLGTAITKLCDTEVARTGLSSAEARAAGFTVVTSTIDATTRAGYYPGAGPMRVRLVVESSSGRLLGAQIVGGDGAAKRIDTCATAITAGMDVQQVLDLDLAYSPPFSPVWDPIATAAREASKVR